MNLKIPVLLGLVIFIMGCGNKTESVYQGIENYGRFELPQEINECNNHTGCFKGGCSGEKCTARQDIITTCELPKGMIGGVSCKCINTQCIWVKSK